MNRLLNQLNKVKNFSDSTSKSKSHDIDSSTATELITAIYNIEQENFSTHSIFVSNSESAILHIGLSLLNPRFVFSRFSKYDHELPVNNLEAFCLPIDAMIATNFPLLENSFDIAVLGPELDKEKSTSTLAIENTQKIAKKVYFCYKNSNKKLIYDRFPMAECIAEIKVSMPGSSKYHKQNSEPEDFGIFKLVK